MTLEPIFDPRKRRPAPSPAKVDLRVIFIAGTIIFAVLTIGFAIVRYGFGMHPGYKFWVCLFGFLIGLIMLVWERFNRSTYMRLANDDETITGLDAHQTDRSADGAMASQSADSATRRPGRDTMRQPDRDAMRQSGRDAADQPHQDASDQPKRPEI